MRPLGATNLSPPTCAWRAKPATVWSATEQPEANLNSAVVIGGSGGDISCDGHTVMERRPVYHSLHPAVPLH